MMLSYADTPAGVNPQTLAFSSDASFLHFPVSRSCKNGGGAETRHTVTQSPDQSVTVTSRRPGLSQDEDFPTVYTQIL